MVLVLVLRITLPFFFGSQCLFICSPTHAHKILYKIFFPVNAQRNYTFYILTMQESPNYVFEQQQQQQQQASSMHKRRTSFTLCKANSIGSGGIFRRDLLLANRKNSLRKLIIPQDDNKIEHCPPVLPPPPVPLRRTQSTGTHRRELLLLIESQHASFRPLRSIPCDDKESQTNDSAPDSKRLLCRTQSSSSICSSTRSDRCRELLLANRKNSLRKMMVPQDKKNPKTTTTTTATTKNRRNSPRSIIVTNEDCETSVVVDLSKTIANKLALPSSTRLSSSTTKPKSNNSIAA